MRQEITWNLNNGQPVRVSVELQTSRKVWADGWESTVACCEMHISVEAAGKPICGVMSEMAKPQTINGKLYTHCIGKLAIPADKADEINAAIAEIEATPEWQAKLVRRAAAEKSNREYEAHRAMMRKVMGY